MGELTNQELYASTYDGSSSTIDDGSCFQLSSMDTK